MLPLGKPALLMLTQARLGCCLQSDGDGSVALAGLTVSCSTERATAGRKRAPVRLAALLVDAEGQPMDVAPVLSPEFYVSAIYCALFAVLVVALCPAPPSCLRHMHALAARLRAFVLACPRPWLPACWSWLCCASGSEAAANHEGMGGQPRSSAPPAFQSCLPPLFLLAGRLGPLRKP